MAEPAGGGAADSGGFPGGLNLPEGFPTDRRFFLVAAVAVVVVLILVFALIRSCGMVKTGSGYVVIYSHLELKDSANVVAKLKELRIPYEIRDGGRAIAVPKNKADETRLALAEEKLPTGGSVGWEIFDETKLGATDFDRRIQFIRALSGELARTINRIDAVDEARVQIVIPETRLFEVERAPVTASVLLRLNPGERLTGPQVNGIIYLVASSVENLKPENVTVVDIYGNIMTPSYVPPTPAMAREEAREEAQIREREIEKEIEREVEEAKKKEMAKVQEKAEELKAKEEALKKKEEELKKLAALEQTRTKEKAIEKAKEKEEDVISDEELQKKVEEEETKPKVLSDEERALLRLKMKKEIDEQLSKKAQILLNKFYPPNTAIIKVNVEIGKSTVEYVPEEVKVGTLKKEVKLKAKEVVTIRRISAVVLVDKRLELDQKLKKDTYAAVAGAIGYDRSRGDTITLRKVPFRLAEAPPSGVKPEAKKGFSLPFKFNVDFSRIFTALKKLYDRVVAYPIVQWAVSLIRRQKNIGKILGGVFGFFFVIWILRKIFASRRGGLPERYEEEEEEEAEMVSGEDRGRAPASLDEMRKAANSNPERLAALLKNWLSEEAS